MTIEQLNQLREKLSGLEHDQWVAWSQDIAKTESITPERLARWKKLWRPYSELTEAEKDQDREWADKALEICMVNNLFTFKDVKRLFELLGSMFVYGDFVVETPNEAEIKEILQRHGYWFESEDDLIDKLYPDLGRRKK